MTSQLNLLPQPELVRLLAALLKELSRLVDDASSVEERLGRLELAFLQLVEKLGILSAVQAQAAHAGHAGKRSREARRKLQEQAAVGISSLKLIPQSGGAALAQFDGRAGFWLPPELAVLLAVLTTPEGSSPDHLVPWRSQESVIEAMQSRISKRFSKKAIHQLVLRLRNLVEARLENRFYVMSDRKHGYRFALRRKPGSVTQPVTG